jgi:hypothetical protein
MSKIIPYRPKELIRFEKKAEAKRDLLIGRMVRLSNTILNALPEGISIPAMTKVVSDLTDTRSQVETLLKAVTSAEDQREALWDAIPDGTRAQILSTNQDNKRTVVLDVERRSAILICDDFGFPPRLKSGT